MALFAQYISWQCRTYPAQPWTILCLEPSVLKASHCMAALTLSLVQCKLQKSIVIDIYFIPQNPFRPASDPSVLKASRNTPALTPSSVQMPPKQAHGEEEVARETAGEFTAAAARARQPDHQAYVQAEHKAGLAGQGARVSAPATSPALLRLRLEVMCKSYSQTAGTDTTAAGHGRQPDHQACIQAKQAKQAKLARAQRCPPCNLFPPCLGMLLGGHARLYGSFPDQQVCWQINAAAARARQPDYQAYVKAEREAGLDGQGAMVCLSATCPFSHAAWALKSRTVCQIADM